MLPRLLPTALLLASTAALVACSAPPAALEGDPGDDTSSEALRTIAATASCNRAKVLASVSGARRTALQRGFTWLDDNVPYSQSRTHAGYRTDCSGFVSMCWQTGTSFTTAIFFSGGGNASALRAFGDLLPGDALVKRGHMMLFTGWADSAKTGVCVLEQASTASDMQFRVRSASSLRGDGYKPIRSNKIASGTSTPDDPSASGKNEEPAEEDPVADPPATEPPPEETEPPPEETEPPPAGSSNPGAGSATPPPPEADPPVADDTENPSPSQLETEPSGTNARTTKKTTKKTSEAEEPEEDDAISTTGATAQQGSACTVARTGAPARGAGLGLFAGLGAVTLLRRRRR